VTETTAPARRLIPFAVAACLAAACENGPDLGITTPDRLQACQTNGTTTIQAAGERAISRESTVLIDDAGNATRFRPDDPHRRGPTCPAIAGRLP